MKANIHYMKMWMMAALILGVATACNPMEVETPAQLAGDFSDPIFPRIYGKVSLTVDMDEDIKAQISDQLKVDPAAATKAIEALIVEFHFKAPDGQVVLAKKYDKYVDMSQIVSFPVGDYTVVAHSDAGADEYYRGETQMTVTEESRAVPAILCSLLAGPFDEDIYPKVFGKLSLSLTAMADLTTPITKADPLQDVGTMVVEFYFVTPTGDRVMCKRYDTYNMIPDIVGFPVGKYEIVAKTQDTMHSVMQVAYFKGMTTIEIKDGDRIQTKVDALMQNSRLTVAGQDGFDVAFKDWSAKLIFKGQTEASAEFNKTNPSTIYIAPNECALHLKATQAGDDLEHTQIIDLKDVKPETAINVTLKGNSTGTVSTEIVITGNINRQDHDINFPDDDDELSGGGHNPQPNPDPDPDPEPTGPPTIIGEGFDVDQIKEISTTLDFDSEQNLKTPIKVIATAPVGGIQMFMITIDSPDIGADLLDPLFGGTSFDLANVPPGSPLETNLDLLGILPIGTTVKGLPSFTFDLTGFMTLLPENTITHNFTLKIKDTKDEAIEKTVKIKRIP